jgi:hypothetical protein
MDPTLFVDRDSNSWTIMGQDMNADFNVLFAGTIGQKGSVRRVTMPDSIAIVGEPIVFGPASTVIVPVYPRSLGTGVLALSPLAMFGADGLRAELLRVVDGRATPVTTMRGYPQCGAPLGGVVACAARHMRATSLYTIDSSGTAVEVAQLPVQDFGGMWMGPGARGAAMSFTQTIVDIDLAARRMTRVTLPPNTDYASEVTSGPGFVVTLSHGVNRRATVRRYRVQ